jgi:GDP-mannose 6-dehydrogenase
MKVSVFGLGYVGAVTAACLAEQGHEVIGVDVSPLKVEQLNGGHAPVIEPQLDELVKEGVRSRRLVATRDASRAVVETDLSLLCVGTPSNGNGSLDLKYIERVCGEVGEVLRAKPSRHVVVIRSTVLPGTAEEVVIPTLERASRKRAGTGFGVCVNPEFLREGSAVRDYYEPSQVVIGEHERSSGDVIAKLYEQLSAPLIRTSLRAAEMVKYASNAFHALKVTFANEIGSLAKHHGVDGRDVMDLLCRDTTLNLSAKYLTPGFAFGGSCLPKDLRALIYRAKHTDVDCPLLESVLESNRTHLERAVYLVEHAGNRRVGVIGLSFKAGTDDVRESPVVALVERLIGRGYAVSIYDELVEPGRLIGENKASLERELPHVASLMRQSVDRVVRDAETLVLANERPPFADIAPFLRVGQHIVDLAGVAPPEARATLMYDGICW